MPAFRDKTPMKDTGEVNVRLNPKHDLKLIPR